MSATELRHELNVLYDRNWMEIPEMIDEIERYTMGGHDAVVYEGLAFDLRAWFWDDREEAEYEELGWSRSCKMHAKFTSRGFVLISDEKVQFCTPHRLWLSDPRNDDPLTLNLTASSENGWCCCNTLQYIEISGIPASDSASHVTIGPFTFSDYDLAKILKSAPSITNKRQKC